MTDTQPIAVTAGDREAAASLMMDIFTGVAGLEGDAQWAATVRRGEDDGYPVVQAFARHAEQARVSGLECGIIICASQVAEIGALPGSSIDTALRGAIAKMRTAIRSADHG